MSEKVSNFMINSSNPPMAAVLIMVIFVMTMITIAIITSKKSRSLSSFFLADRGIGGWMTAFSYGAAYFSAVVFIGYAGKFGMQMGLASIWIGLANAFIGSLLAWLVLAKRTRQMTRALGTRTMPEFFEKRYNNKYIKLISSIIIFIFLIPYCSSVYQGLGYLFEMIFGIKFYWCIIIVSSLTGLYLFAGGYFATVLGDFIQGIIMIIGVAIMITLMFKSPTVNGIEGLRTLSQEGYGVFPTFSSPSGRIIDSSAFKLITIILLTSFGIWSLPQSVHKFHAIRNNKAIIRATVVSTIFALIIGVGAYLNGGLARLFFPQGYPAEGVDAVVPQMLMRANFPGAILGLIMILVLSASMSTLSSLTLSSSSAVAIDGYKGYINKKASDEQVRIIMKLLCIVFIALSAILAVFRVDAIVTLMSLSWGTLAGCFIGPFIYGLYSKKATSAAALTSIVSGVIITIILIFIFGAVDGGTGFVGIIKTGIQQAPLIGVITMIASMIIMPTVSAFTKKLSKKHLEDCFTKTKEGID